jgi:hypothetical protein
MREIGHPNKIEILKPFTELYIPPKLHGVSFLGISQEELVLHHNRLKWHIYRIAFICFR